MRERAADRPAVADLLVGDPRRRLGQHAQLRAALEVGVAGQRADPPAAVLALDRAQAGDPAQVDEQRRRRQPQPHQRQQRVAAGERLRLLAAVGERGQRGVERVGGGVVELGRDHLRASWIACHTRSDVSGMSR